MSAATTENLADLELSEEERAAEEQAESAYAQRLAARREELQGLSDEQLEAISGAEDSPTIDVNLADELLESRAGARAEQAELDGEGAGEPEPEAAEGPAEDDGKRASLEQEAGEAVGEMPAAEPEGSSAPPMEIIVQGPQEKRIKASGKQPGRTIIKLSGVKFEAEGGFRKGERFRFEGEALVTSDTTKDKLDKDTKQPIEAIEEHDARVLDFELLEG